MAQSFKYLFQILCCQGEFTFENSLEDGYHWKAPIDAFPPQNDSGKCRIEVLIFIPCALLLLLLFLSSSYCVISYNVKFLVRLQGEFEIDHSWE